MRLKSGFTLIELSIVLVIIGLIVGGILTGRDLIDAAAQRAQITQIERYQTSVRTFQGKYGGLPGDLPIAAQFGFQPRGLYNGEGDGNGILESNCGNTPNAAASNLQRCGELAVFWQDLSTAGLIDANMKGHDTNGLGYPWINGGSSLITPTSTPSLNGWFPSAKIGGANNFVYPTSYAATGNYFTVSSITSCCNNDIYSSANPGITVQQAYNIDKKMDDGWPQSGNVTACYTNYNVENYNLIYASGGMVKGANGGLLPNPNFGGCCSGSYCNPTTTATSPASTDCFGNNNTTGTMTYSVSTNANTQNCALSFKFQ